ncbi:hypothetical protein GOP47_0026728 [Adiantum capillus-veneris]|nr:hypothetical protein GOP47_0026728 [Adiantum capillus-veneris]
MPHPAEQVSNSSIIQNHDASGTVLGVPVMGTPVFLGANNLAPPDIQHHQQPVQKLHPESSYPRQQSSKSIYHLTKYFQRSVSNCESQTEEGRPQQCGWQPPARQANRAIFGRKYSRANMGRKYVPNANKLSFEKPDQKQLAYTHRNGHQSHYSHQRDLFHESSASVEKKPSHSESTQIPNIKASSASIPTSYCEDIDKRSDQRSLEFDSHEASSLALACSEAQLNSLVKSKQEELSPEIPGETATECKLSYADNMSPARQFTKNTAGVTRWLEQRKTKYPTPANMQRKAEERRMQEEMGEFICKKPRNYLRHFQGALSTSYYRCENQKIDKKPDVQEQRLGESQVAKSDSKGHTSNLGNDPDHCGNDFEMPMEIEDSGPVESPYQGQVSDVEKGVQEENFQSTSKSDEITEQNQEEKIRAPCFAFVFRRKRQEQRRGRSALVAQRQKRQLFQLFSRDLEKENSHLLQCCSYMVSNGFLQGLHHMNPTHPSIVAAEKRFDVNNSHDKEIDTAETVAIASVKNPVSGHSAVNHLVLNNQHSANLEEQVLSFEGADSCQNATGSTLANGKQSCTEMNLVQEAHCSAEVSAQERRCSTKEQGPIEDADGPTMPEVSGSEVVDSCLNERRSTSANGKQSCATVNLCQGAPCSAELSAQEMGCSSKEQELIGDAPGPMMPVDNIVVQEAYCSAVVPSQTLDWSSKGTEQIAGACKSSRSREELMSGYMEQSRFADEAFTRSSRQLCDEIDEESCLVVEPSLTRFEKEAIFPWRHSDSYHLRNVEGGLAPAHYDCFKAPLIASSVDADTNQLAVLSSNSNLDSQVSVSSLWDQPNSGLNVPDHNMDTSDLGTGYCDSFLDNEDDIFQYMNFDGFDTDSGMCFG